MKADENKPAPTVVKDGEKVTGGKHESTETELYESAGTDKNEGPSHEADSQSDTKKEDMESYNEHPDQVKVGGG